MHARSVLDSNVGNVHAYDYGELNLYICIICVALVDFVYCFTCPQVEQVLTVEELLPNKLRKKFRITYVEVKPNSRNSRFNSFIAKVGFYIWGGDRYDSHECISRALHPSVVIN